MYRYRRKQQHLHLLKEQLDEVLGYSDRKRTESIKTSFWTMMTAEQEHLKKLVKNLMLQVNVFSQIEAKALRKLTSPKSAVSKLRDYLG